MNLICREKKFLVTSVQVVRVSRWTFRNRFATAALHSAKEYDFLSTRKQILKFAKFSNNAVTLTYYSKTLKLKLYGLYLIISEQTRKMNMIGEFRSKNKNMNMINNPGLSRRALTAWRNLPASSFQTNSARSNVLNHSASGHTTKSLSKIPRKNCYGRCNT